MDYDMRVLAPTVATLLEVRPPARAEVGPVDELVAHLAPAARVAMVVIDAFGLATWDHTRDLCPTVNELAAMHQLPLRAVLPPITPVNFATMVTGASPEAHTIRDRTEALRLETLFDVLQARGKLAAAVGRAQSTVGILLAPLAAIGGVAASNQDQEVLDIGLSILRSHQPDYFLLQFLAVDAASHRYGPLSDQNAQAVAETDAHLRGLVQELAARSYSLLLLADHGQHTAPPDQQTPGHIGTHDGTSAHDLHVPLIWATPEELRTVTTPCP